VVEKLTQVAKAMMANNHSRHRMNPRGSFSTRVSMTVVPIGWKENKGKKIN
jgi:hypothetical protein